MKRWSAWAEIRIGLSDETEPREQDDLHFRYLGLADSSFEREARAVYPSSIGGVSGVLCLDVNFSEGGDEHGKGNVGI